jgi:hypothetical protein
MRGFFPDALESAVARRSLTSADAAGLQGYGLARTEELALMTNAGTRALIILAVALAAVAATGCRSRASRDARMMARYERNVIRYAARDTGCSANQLTPQQITQEPAVVTVTGCTTPIEYWLDCRGRGGRYCRWHNVPHLNESAAQALACPPQAIQQQLTQSPNVRYATGCGRTGMFTMMCNGAACGWALSGPVQGGPMVAGPPGQVGAPPPNVPVPPPGQQPSNILSSQVQLQREAILSCVDEGSLTLNLRWTADGQVLVQLPPHLQGTAAEGCIQAVVGSLRVSAQAAGEVSVSVQ